jgi:hypothetical protein
VTPIAWACSHVTLDECVACVGTPLELHGFVMTNASRRTLTKCPMFCSDNGALRLTMFELSCVLIRVDMLYHALDWHSALLRTVQGQESQQMELPLIINTS